MSESDFFFTRHTLRPDPPTEHDEALPESLDYTGITDKGVELAKERAEEITHIVEGLPSDGIMFIGGASDLERTKSTGEVYGDALAEHFNDREDIIVVTREDIDMQRQEVIETGGKILNSIQQAIDANPGKKIVFVYPLSLKEFSLTPNFIDPRTNKRTEYTNAIYEAGQGHEDKAAKVLVESTGEVEIGGERIQGITPQEIAEKHLHGIKRLQEFADNFANNREVVVGIIGHAWTLDAFVSYLANNGIAGIEGWNNAGDQMIDKTEMGKVSFKDNSVIFSFRGKQHLINPELLK